MAYTVVFICTCTFVLQCMHTYSIHVHPCTCTCVLFTRACLSWAARLNLLLQISHAPLGDSVKLCIVCVLCCNCIYMQLEARLERMERRLAVHQKRNAVTASTPEIDTHVTPTNTLSASRRRSRTESLILSERLPRSRSSSVERSRGRLRPSSHAGTPISQEEGGEGKRSARKRLRTEENSYTTDSSSVKRIKKPPKLTEIRTKLEYRGLDLLPSSEDAVTTLLSNHTDSLAENIEDTVNEVLSSKHLSSNDVLSNSVVCNDATIVGKCSFLRPLYIQWVT